MKRSLKILIGFSVAVSLLTVAYFDVLNHTLHPAYLPRGVETVLENADTFTLFSINPEPDFGKGKNVFRGHEILGQLNVHSKVTRVQLIDALEKGISAEDKRLGPGPKALPSCFSPRHGVRAKEADEIVELLICFQCNQIYITSRSATNQLFMTTGDPAMTFDKVLKGAGVPLPAN